MVQGVPAIGVMTELVQLCALYGTVEEYRPLDEYPAEEFTEVYLIKFQKLTSARYTGCGTMCAHYTSVKLRKRSLNPSWFISSVSGQRNVTWMRKVSTVVCCMFVTSQNMRLWKTPG